MNPTLPTSEDTLIKNWSIEVGIVVLGVALPLLMLVFIQGMEGSEFVEEIGKALIIILLISRLSSRVRQMVWSCIFGLLFGVSEALFYLGQAFQMGNTDAFWVRFVTTVPLHGVTALVIALPMVVLRNRWGALIGLALAIALHLFFNQYLAWGV